MDRCGDIRVAFQGVHGAFSEDAITQFFGEEVATIPCPEFEDVFRKVETSEASFGVVPIENSLEGSVNPVSDLLLNSDLTVVGEILLAINQCLIGHPGAEISDIRRVFSHPQALGQCRSFLLSHPSWERIPTFDTAGSVEMIRTRGDRAEAAIASKRAAKSYGMQVLAENIQNSKNNFTKFFVIQRTSSIVPEGDKTTLVFATRNTPGALYNCLGALVQNEVNMTKLESRPRKERPWEYVFYVDIDGHVNDERVSRALTELVRRASFVKVLGSYKRAKAPTS